MLQKHGRLCGFDVSAEEKTAVYSVLVVFNSNEAFDFPPNFSESACTVQFFKFVTL